MCYGFLVFIAFLLVVIGQVLGTVPTISIDKTDGCQMYMSDKSLDVEVISSKSTEMNVLIPKGNGDFVSLYLCSRNPLN